MSLATLTETKQYASLKEHFHLGYQLFAEAKIIPEANFESDRSLVRCLSGIPFVYNNGVLDCLNGNKSWSQCVEEQLHYFNQFNLPFVWYVNEESNPELEKTLMSHGFNYAGIFQGVLGTLDKPIPKSDVSPDYELICIRTAQELAEFNELVCEVFMMKEPIKQMYHQVLANDVQKKEPLMSHWLARYQGQAVSAVSILIKNQTVSFWNGATKPAFRRRGLSTALRSLALQEAKTRGCQIGTSYLMAEALALGVCRHFGYQPIWRFKAFVSPTHANG